MSIADFTLLILLDVAGDQWAGVLLDAIEASWRHGVECPATVAQANEHLRNLEKALAT